MPSPLARLDGDSTRLACGSVRHQALSTSRPNAVSAAPYGRGLTSGSLSRHAVGHDRRRDRVDPHPAVSSAARASPGGGPEFVLHAQSDEARPAAVHTLVEFLIPVMAQVRREAPSRGTHLTTGRERLMGR